MKAFEVVVGGIVIIGGILAVAGLTIYALWWLSIVALRRVPMIGRRHKHAAWDRLNHETRSSTRGDDVASGPPDIGRAHDSV